MIFLDDGTYEEDYKHINRTILDGNVMNMFLIMMEGHYSAIDSDDSTCHDYYIIIFSSCPYTLQADLNIDGRVISSGEIIREAIFSPINTNSQYYVFHKESTKSSEIQKSSKIINEEANI